MDNKKKKKRRKIRMKMRKKVPMKWKDSYLRMTLPPFRYIILCI